MDQVLPAPSTVLDTWVCERLRQEPIAWLTTVDAAGIAQPNPVWFVWDGESILVYNRGMARRLANIRRRPQVALYLETYGRGGDAVVLIGLAAMVPDEPLADQQPAFLENIATEWIWIRSAGRSPFRLRCASNPLGYRQAGPDRPGVT